MAKRIVVLINASAGQEVDDAVRRERVGRAFSACGLVAEIHVVAAPRLTSHARELVGQGVDIIVAAGGDGTVSGVAHALVGRETLLGVLPLGTLNHFAKDLRIPIDLDLAVGVIAAAQWREIDVGEVNGRSFINNSSIGLYPTIVGDRERQRADLGRRKYVAMAIAMWRACRRLPLMRVRFALEGWRFTRLLPFVFIGNNRYALPSGGRERLDAGRLWCSVPISRGRFAVVRLMLFALLRHLHQVKEVYELPIRQVVLSRHGMVEVGIDGEIVRLRSPLRFRIRPRALRVIAPGSAA